MERKTYRHRFQRWIEILKKLSIPSKIIFTIIGVLSTIWFLVRVIPKPSRAAYPCVRATAPWASAFVVYLLTITASFLSFKRFHKHLKAMRLPIAAFFFCIAIGFSIISITQNSFQTKAADPPPLEEVNSPIGSAKGLFPGRVVWAFNPDATNKACSNDWGDGYFLESNTDQRVVDRMVVNVLKRLTEEHTLAEAWDAIFKYHNQERGKGDIGYASGEIVFLKINATSTWGGNFSTSDLSRRDNLNYAISETSPQLVFTVLDHLVNTVGVAQNDIYIGDPLKHIYKDNYEKWHAKYPDVHYLDNSYTNMGREAVSASSSAVIDYSDRGAVLREGDWSDPSVGDPIYTDKLYSIFEEMEYMINLPTLKGHERGGVTMFAKNHFGSHTRGDAKHLHMGLVKQVNPDDNRNQYGMYRVLVDIMGHELLGKKNLIYLMDALYSSDYEVDRPDKFQKAPWNNDWSSSIFVSQDPVAIESVGFDVLYYEMDGANGYESYPHYGAVDDYLHQASDETFWPEGIVYDPENDGSKITSLGVHEHWNNPVDMQYSRNLGTGNGIELIKIFPAPYGSEITMENSNLPSNNVNTIYVDSSMTAWIGTDAGLSRLTKDSLTNYDTILLGKNVNDIAYERTTSGKELWLATDSGLTVSLYTDLDGITGSTTYLPENSDLVGRSVVSVVVDSDHNRWIATDSAINVFKGSIWAQQLIGIDAMGDNFNFIDNQISDIAIHEPFSMALIATEGMGISRMSYSEIDGFTGASTYASPWASINSNNISSIGVNDTAQWYGTDIGAYFHPGEKTKGDWNLFNANRGIVDNAINAIYIDSEKNAWLGTPSGISIVTPHQDIYIYTEDEGLINNYVNSLSADYDGKIWVGTAGGIQIIDIMVGDQVAIGKPELLEPLNYAIDLEDSISLKWNASPTATQFKIKVAADDDFENILVDEANLTSTIYSLSSLPYDSVFYWKVAAVNANLTSDWTSTYTFSTGIDDHVDLAQIAEFKVEIYPIPFSSYLVIESPEFQGDISLYDMSGKLKYRHANFESQIRMDTKDLNEGVYVLQLSSTKGRYSYKIIK